MQSPCVGVITALPAEAQSLTLQKLQIGQTLLLKPRLLLHVSGMGHARAHAGAVQLIRYGARALVSWGTAGGLAPGLEAGKLVLPDIVMNEQNQIFKTDASWRNELFLELKNNVAISHEPLLQARDIVASVHDKRSLFSQFKAVAVDLESAAIGIAARQANIKFIAVRSIVDSAEQAFPAWLRACLTEQGEVKSLELFKKVLKPQRFIELVGLFRAFSLAQASLKTAAAMMDFSDPSIVDSSAKQDSELVALS